MEDHKEDNATNNPVEKLSENPSVEIIPTTFVETNNPEYKSDNMEVHHHAHHGGAKNWKSYLWEFLMLFLAVFCGFLAEYQLEHKIESDRAKELAKSFYEELKGDSTNVMLKTENRIKQENAIRYLMKYFKDSSVAKVSKIFAINFNYGITFRTPSLFEPRTVVLEQLKNSGSLRYFKNEELQKLIGDLSVAIHNINDRQALESAVRTEYINPLIVKHYDMDFAMALNELGGKDVFENILLYEKSDTVIPFQFKKMDSFDAQGAVNALGFYAMNGLRSTRQIHYTKYTEINAKLIQALRKEYHLD
jgi:hypothetical protein